MSRGAERIVRSYRVWIAAAALAALACGTIAWGTGAFARWEGDSVDLRFGLRGADPPDELVVVAIDDVSFSELRQRWPFSRTLHARAIDRLRAAGAREIVYDVQFTEPTDQRSDMALYEAVGRARDVGVVLATTEVDARGRTNVLGGDDNLARIGAIAAASNIPADRGGVMRRFAFEEAGLHTLAVASARRAGGPRLSPSLFAHDDGALIDYRGPPGTVPTVSFSRVVQGKVPDRWLRGKVVVVGASAPTLQDVHPTSTSHGRLMSGPEIQANAIWTALHGVPLREAPWWLALACIVLLALLAPAAALRLRGPRVGLAAPVVAAAYVAMSVAAFEAGWVLPLIYPIAALVVGTGMAVGGGYLVEARERQRVSSYSEELEREVSKRTEELRQTQLEIVRRLGQAAESRDHETGAHIERIGRLCHSLGQAAGMSAAEAELLRDASALHDVGKIGIPDYVLLKQGEFTAEEREVMKGHCAIGGDILAGSGSPLVRMAETIARTHHERWDGTGYPAGLKGEEIPLPGRITAICDVFDALMSARRYKRRWTTTEALREIAGQSGHAFDPRLVELFLALPQVDGPVTEPERVSVTP